MNEIIKDSFNSLLADARAERDRVNAAFLQTSHDLEKGQKGFGVNFWGSTWRFQMMQDFYTHPINSTGLIRCNLRYSNLKARLASVRDGTDAWISTVMVSNPKIRSEIVKPEAVRDFCAKWLDMLTSLERTTVHAKEDLSA